MKAILIFWILPFIGTIIFTVLFSLDSNGAQREADYRRKWCAARRGRMEVAMPNRTRCDCLTRTHAVEFDFAPKWLEAVGQSLNYAEQTRKRAGIVLICRRPRDGKRLGDLRKLIRFYGLPVDVWSMGCD